jgi:hypothetical protein
MSVIRVNPRPVEMSVIRVSPRPVDMSVIRVIRGSSGRADPRDPRLVEDPRLQSVL